MQIVKEHIVLEAKERKSLRFLTVFGQVVLYCACVSTQSDLPRDPSW